MLSTTILAAIPNGVFAQDSVIHATGLLPPTPEQAAWMKQNFPSHSENSLKLNSA